MKNLGNVIMLIVALFVGNSLFAQTLTFNAKKSNILIEGKSNVHDWTTNVNEVNGKITADVPAKELKTLTVEVPVSSIISGDKTMDKKTHETFKSKQHPTIKFELTKVKSLNVGSTNIDAVVTGNLTMAGVTKPIDVKVVGKGTAGSFIFTGDVPLKMTDYGMKPPKAMLVMQVKDEINLKLNITIDGFN